MRRDAGRGPGRAAAALALALGACTDATTTIAPVVDLPIDDADASPTPLDTITLTVAHAGSDTELVSQTFRRGQALELPGAPFGDDLVVHMLGFVGQSNVAYGRTCEISVAADSVPAAPHLFFSREVKFASTALAPLPRIGGLGVPYLGTALLVGGGGADGSSVSEVERFDPLTGELTVVGAVLARDHAVQALIGASPPRVVVVGGAVVGGVTGMDGAKFIEVVDARRIERVDNTDMARVDLTATALTDGRVVVIGGRPPGGGPLGAAPLGDIDEVSPLPDTTLAVRKLGSALATPRSGHTATRLGDDVGAPVLIAGGENAAGDPIAAAELFKPLGGQLADPELFKHDMKVPRRNHTAVLMPDGSVLFIGGFDTLDQPVKALELFSVDAGFVPVGELPDGAGLVDFAATTLPDGRILLTGGRTSPGGQAVNNAYIVRLNFNQTVDVVSTDHLAVARAGHQAVALCDGTVLISGGTTVQLPAERYNPPPDGRR
jgi:hypothetical protein